MAKKIDLTKYGITGTPEILYNPSYERLFEEEMNPALTGYERGQLTDTGAVNVMTGEYTGRSPKDKFFVMDDTTRDTIWWTSDEYKNDNKPVSEEAWKELKKIATNELSNKKLFVMDTFCGANANTRLKIRFIMENMPFFISPPYHVLMMTCTFSVRLKTTAVSELRPSSL